MRSKLRRSIVEETLDYSNKSCQTCGITVELHLNNELPLTAIVGLPHRVLSLLVLESMEKL